MPQQRVSCEKEKHSHLPSPIPHTPRFRSEKLNKILIIPQSERSEGKKGTEQRPLIPQILRKENSQNKQKDSRRPQLTPTSRSGREKVPSSKTTQATIPTSSKPTHHLQSRSGFPTPLECPPQRSRNAELANEKAPVSIPLYLSRQKKTACTRAGAFRSKEKEMQTKKEPNHSFGRRVG